jgi:hypothetical protein
MNDNIKVRPPWIVLAIVVCSVFVVIMTKSKYTVAIEPGNKPEQVQPKDTANFTNFKNSAINQNCFKCHGQSKYTYTNKESGKEVYKRMYSELIVDRSLFYESNHREFKCIDCHSEDYNTFPHPGNLRMEAKPNCIDCHGGDEKYAKFHFENIEKEFQESVHSEKHSEDFTCWMCHNAHTYKINARSNENIKQTVLYDNNICLNCHGDITRYQLLTDKQNPNLIQKHDWLPNQPLHFRSVRCIECHTKKINDSTLVAHKILPKSEALKRCEECHSTNSVLMASLYQYKVKEIRSTRGFVTGSIVNDSYVIGANRNFYLNVVSVIIASLVLIGIFIHAFLRIFKN